MTQTTEQILKSFDEAASSAKTLPLKSVKVLLSKFDKQLNTNQSDEDLSISRKAFSYWLYSDSTTNLIQVQLYEKLFENCKGQPNIEKSIEQFNKYMNEKGFKAIDEDKMAFIINENQQNSSTLYYLYRSSIEPQKKSEAQEKKEVSEEKNQEKKEENEQKKDEKKDEKKEEQQEKQQKQEQEKKSQNEEKKESQKEKQLEQEKQNEKEVQKEEDKPEEHNEKKQETQEKKEDENKQPENEEKAMDYKQQTQKQEKVMDSKEEDKKSQKSQKQEEKLKADVAIAEDQGFIEFFNEILQKQYEEEKDSKSDKINVNLILGENIQQKNASISMSRLSSEQTSRLLQKAQVKSEKLLFFRVQNSDLQQLKKQIDSLNITDYDVKTSIVDDQIFITVRPTDKQIMILEGMKEIEQKLKNISGSDETFDFGIKLILPSDNFQFQGKTFLQTLLDGFDLSLRLEMNSLIWKTIRKNLERKYKDKPWLGLMKNSNLKFKFKTISQGSKFLSKLGIEDAIKQTPRMRQFIADIMEMFSKDKSMPFNTILSAIFSSESIKKLSFNSYHGAFGISFEMAGSNIEKVH